MSAHAATLSGAVQFSTDASGAASAFHVWNTASGDITDNLFLSTDSAGTTFYNGPADTDAAISIPLSLGSNTFFIWGQPGSSTGFNAINLYFDGSTTAAITATGATNSTSFSADGASATWNLSNASVPGANTLTYNIGTEIITLTAYAWYTPTATALPAADKVGAFTLGADGKNDFRGYFTLDVASAPAPEPSTYVLMGAGLLTVALAKKRTAKS